MKSLAQELRKKQTPPEKKLWSCLRNHHLCGVSFRRQVPIGPYIVDFCSFEKNLIVEVDGKFHQEQVEKDQIRERYLKEAGFRILRFSANEVMNTIDGVLFSISQMF